MYIYNVYIHMLSYYLVFNLILLIVRMIIGHSYH